MISWSPALGRNPDIAASDAASENGGTAGNRALCAWARAR